MNGLTVESRNGRIFINGKELNDPNNPAGGFAKFSWWHLGVSFSVGAISTLIVMVWVLITTGVIR